MEKNYKIIENFLPKDKFIELQHLLFSNEFPYFYNKTLNAEHKEGDNSSYFTHTLYEPHLNYTDSNYYSNFVFITNMLDVKSSLRMKVNLYSRTDIIQEHSSHADYDFEHKGFILSMNTCNGCTILDDGTKIDSIENRALFFDPSKLHHSTTCTDEKVRINIILNYL